jgi:transcriptional regulator with XRE-family HTH domain
MSSVVPFPRRDEAAELPLWREVAGDILREERKERGERIADVAQRAGVSGQYLSEIERGVKDPSSEILSSVAGALGLSLLDLTERAGRRLQDSRPRGDALCLAA